jgi:hypothetical protein
MWKHIAEWYRGPYVPPPPNDPNSPVALFLMGRHEPHWTARYAQVLVAFWLAHWQWVIGTSIAVAGLLIAYTKLG